MSIGQYTTHHRYLCNIKELILRTYLSPIRGKRHQPPHIFEPGSPKCFVVEVATGLEQESHAGEAQRLITLVLIPPIEALVQAPAAFIRGGLSILRVT